MALMSPFQYRLHRAKEAIFGDDEVFYESLVNYKAKLPGGVHVAWQRDGAFIVGKIVVGGHVFVAQGRSAKEFVEEVNDTLYAAYGVPVRYAERLGGGLRLMPPEKALKALDNEAIQGSNLTFEPLLA